MCEIIFFNSGEISRQISGMKWICFWQVELHCLNKLYLSYTAYLSKVVAEKQLYGKWERLWQRIARRKILGKVITLPKKDNLVIHRVTNRFKT